MEDGQGNQSHSTVAPVAEAGPAWARKNSQAGYLRLLADALIGGDFVQRPALARQVGLSRLAVSELLAELEVRGLVRVEGKLGGAPGRSQLSYALRSDAALVIGFDVGGTKVAGAVADLRGQIIAETVEPTVQTGLSDLIAQLARMADTMCRDAELARFRLRIGAVGVPAAVDPSTGDLTLAGNLPGLEGGNLRSGLRSALGVDVLVDNDVNLALLAEVEQGSGQGHQNVAFIAIGTGIGSALMINGHLLRGAHGGAGELGYLPLWAIEAPGIPPLENRVGEAGIRRAYVQLGGSSSHSVRDIFAVAASGEAAASAALDEAAEHVARAVLALLALLDPDLIVFGGNVGARAEFISRVEQRVARAWPRPLKIICSQGGGRAGLLGALALGRSRLLDDMFGPAPRG